MSPACSNALSDREKTTRLSLFVRRSRSDKIVRREREAHEECQRLGDAKGEDHGVFEKRRRGETIEGKFSFLSLRCQ